jgi:hypothetical protein
MYQGVEAYPRWGPASLLIHMEGAGFEPSVPLEVLAVSGSSLVVSADLSTLPSRKRSSQRTQRWREPDSNHRSRRERNGYGRAPKSILAISDLTLGGSTDRADVPIGNAQQSLLQQRDRWFESGFLQQRVMREPQTVRTQDGCPHR